MNLTQALDTLGNMMQSMDSTYDYYAKQIGLNKTTLQLLYILYASEGCTQKAICDQLLLPKQTVNTIVRDYQQQGLLVAFPDSRDRRQKQLCLTEAGRAYCDRIMPPVGQAEQQAMEQFTDEERQQLMSLMTRYNLVFRESMMKAAEEVHHA